MSKVKIKEIEAKVVSAFIKAGVSEEDAKIVTRVLTDAQMKGIFTHGYIRVPKYIECIKAGGLIPKSEITTLVDTPSWALVDGCGGLGIAISCKATELAIKKAKETGVGIVNVRGSQHFGPAGYYTAMCADAGLMGISMSNGNAIVAVTGSCENSIGNNPFSYAVPAGKYDKIVYDVAISAVSDMKVIQMAKEGKSVPDGWLIDKNGVPTNNPEDYLNGGVLLPFGGYKGYGLALMVEMFAAVLSGADTTRDVNAWNKTTEKTGNTGHIFIALDMSKMGDRDAIVKRVEAVLDGIKGSKLAVGADTIYYPGEKELISKNACLASGEVEVFDEVISAIEALA